MSQDGARKALHAYVSDDAHEQWHGFAAAGGVSVSAVLEALASELLLDGAEGQPMTQRLDEVISAARSIDASRRRRRR